MSIGDDPQEKGPGVFLAHSPLGPADGFISRCVAAPPAICTYEYPVIAQACDVVEVKELGVYGASQYRFIRYLRSVTYDQGGGQRYSCKTDEAALTEFPGGGLARPVWADATDREYMFIGSPSHYGRDGSGILSIPYCLNGSGGCTQTLLIWTQEGRWRYLARDASWEPVYQSLPEGYRPHKSPEIDFGNFTWEQHIAKPGDANCCPSGKVLFNLSIEADRLHVVDYRIVTEADRIRQLKTTPAHHLDDTLSAVPFEDWLSRNLPEGAAIEWEINDCGEQTGAPERDRGREFPRCVGVEIEMTSRDRHVSLLFQNEPSRMRTGLMTSPAAKGITEFVRLSDLPQHMKAQLALEPLACPASTALNTRPSDAGLYEWCEGPKGKHGPARSWFSTGIYLMARGAYTRGQKTGPWIECDRFERCREKTYESAVIGPDG